MMNEFKATTEQNRSPIDTGFVASLLSDVFGVNTPRYVPWFFEDKKNTPTFQDVELEETHEYENAPVRYGQKTFGAFWLLGGTYKTWDLSGKPKDREFNKFLMPLATMVDFSRDKTVTKTPTTGGSGTVKEIYALDDWSISINGLILPDKYNPYTQQTVAQQMEAIQAFHEIAGSINVEGQLFAERHITRIVTESLSFTPVQGKPHLMQYSISAVSDADILLTDII